MTEEAEVQILNESTAIAWAAENLIDSHDIAKKREDTETMLKIAEAWMKISGLLAQGPVEQEQSDEGTGHYL